MPSETTILVIMLAGVIGGAVGARKSVPAWKGIFVALAFMFGGGVAMLFIAPSLQGATAFIFSLIISILCVVVVGGILKVDGRSATKILLVSVLYTIGAAIISGTVSAMYA